MVAFGPCTWNRYAFRSTGLYCGEDRSSRVELHIVPAGLGIEFHPVVHRRTAHQVEQTVLQPEQNYIPDHVAFGTAGDELFGLVRAEILERVDAQIAEQLERIGALHVHVGHVKRLVEQDARLLPSLLFIPPVGVLAGHHRINVRPHLRIAQ